jgi:uncharacterized protein involved in exopolysaccharide biosynthesis
MESVGTDSRREGLHMTAGPEERSLLEMLSVVVRYRRVVFGLPLALALTAAATGFLRTPSYTASAAFVPRVADPQQGRFAGLAAQFGVGVPAGGASESLDFFVGLIRSRGILTQIVAQEFAFEHDGEPFRGRLTELLEVEGSTEALRREKTVRHLKDRVSSEGSYETGVVTLSVQTPWPELSAEVVQRLLTLTSEFNLETRQSRARAERIFVESRVDEAGRDLRAAEDRLQAFLQGNRQFANSAALTFDRDRLQREVAMRQQVYTTLVEALERARIEEVRDTPVLTVLVAPEVPVFRDPRGTLVRGLLGFGLGLFLAIILAFVLDNLRRARRAASPDYREFVQLRQEALLRLRGRSPVATTRED